MGQSKKLKLENGNTVLAYPSSLRNTYINEVNCDTEYEETYKGSSVYVVVKK